MMSEIMGEVTSNKNNQNAMLSAYSYLIENAKQAVIKAELKSWDLLGKTIMTIEEKESVLEELTKEQLEKVREDVYNDCMQLAEYLNDLEQGVEQFISMEWEQLEGFLLEKSNQLADPTDLMVIRMRIMAVMNKK
ncbi:MAG TPA: hypothetical protein DD716_01410 [Thiomicrospira sp.]|jgi:hypothetical protein|nr:hypothetical protein [Thiomicrospira sp.]